MKKLLDRFLQYVSIDTESASHQQQFPSTNKQLDLARVLYDQLVELGAHNVELDQYGYVYATIPATVSVDNGYSLGFVAHMDTSEAVSGKDVKPVFTYNYDGTDIDMGNGYTLSPSQFPSLLEHIGKTIVCTDGTTLLGADDKAGVAILMTMASILLGDKSIEHGEIHIAFTPDEEVGRGTDFFDTAKFGCDGAYTLDGSRLGELEYENFNAGSCRVDVTGVSAHPGAAKGCMINASLVLMELQSLLPEFDNPMYTEGYEGFYHLCDITATCDSGVANYIIRDHDMDKYQAKKKLFAQCVEFLQHKYGQEVVSCQITDSYFNMKEHVLPHIHLVDNAKLAMEKLGIKSITNPIRGGTDGARLSYMGVPCPNLFTGGFNFHGRYEYIPVEDMGKAVEVVMQIIDIYKTKTK